MLYFSLVSRVLEDVVFMYVLCREIQFYPSFGIWQIFLKIFEEVHELKSLLDVVLETLWSWLCKKTCYSLQARGQTVQKVCRVSPVTMQCSRHPVVSQWVYVFNALKVESLSLDITLMGNWKDNILGGLIGWCWEHDKVAAAACMATCGAVVNS